MEELKRYNSIQELKENSKLADPTAVTSAERHEKFKRFINFLKDDEDTSSKDTSMSRSSTHGLQ